MAGLMACAVLMTVLQLIFWSESSTRQEGSLSFATIALATSVLCMTWYGLGRLFKIKQPALTGGYWNNILEVCVVAIAEEAMRCLAVFAGYTALFSLFGSSAGNKPWVNTWGWAGATCALIANVLFAGMHLVMDQRGKNTGWLGPFLAGLLFSAGLLRWGPIGAISLHVFYNALGMSLIYYGARRDTS